MKKMVIAFFAVMMSLSLFAGQGISERIIKELSLSNEQIEKINKLESDTKISENFIQLEIKKLELKKLLLKEEGADRNAVKKALEDIAMLEVEIKLSRYDKDKEILNILDKSQQQKYKMLRMNPYPRQDRSNFRPERDIQRKKPGKK